MNKRIYKHQVTLDVDPDKAFEIIRYTYFPNTSYSITGVTDCKRQVRAEFYPNKQVRAQVSVDVGEVSGKPNASVVDVEMVVDMPPGILVKLITNFQKADHAAAMNNSIVEVVNSVKNET